MTKERMWGMAAPIGLGPPVAGRGAPPRRWASPTKRLRGMAPPIDAGPAAGGTGSAAQEVVAA